MVTSSRAPRRRRSLRSALALAALAAAGALLAPAFSRGDGQRAAAQAAPAAGPFAWLRREPVPAGWRVAQLPSGASLPYPPGWHTLGGDAGSFSAALAGPDGRVLAYLNATPRQGAESLAGWIRFRPRHLRAEGDRAVRVLSSATGLAPGAGRGACVGDEYSTSLARYREVACLVEGRPAATVLVAAAEAGSWRRYAPVLESALAGARP